MPDTNERLAGDDREAQKHMAESHKPLTPGQRDELPAKQDNGFMFACRDLDGQECTYEAAGESIDEVRDSMMRHYIDKHPGHNVDDALTLALSERYRM
jgi:predicted small metal-binding protein